MLEDKRLTELHQERFNNQFNVGDVYLGKIKKVMPGVVSIVIERKLSDLEKELPPEISVPVPLHGEAADHDVVDVVRCQGGEGLERPAHGDAGGG